MNASRAFERYEALRDWVEIIEAIRQRLLPTSKSRPLQQEYKEFALYLIYESENSAKRQIENEVQTQEYRSEFGWEFTGFEKVEYLDPVELQECHAALDKLDLLRDGKEHLLSGEDRGEFNYYRALFRRS